MMNTIRISLICLFTSCASILSSGQTLGRLTQDLHARDAYSGQSPYMDFYHSLALGRDDVDISLGALLSIDGVVSSGLVREDGINQIYPFPNKIVILKMTGEEVRRYLEASYAAWIGTPSENDGHVLLLKSSEAQGNKKWNFKNSPANFDSAAGINYIVDIMSPEGSRVKIVSMADGSPFEEGKEYRVAITDYRARGSGKLLQAAGIDPKGMEDRVLLRGPEFRTILRERLEADTVLDPASMTVGSWEFVPREVASGIIASDLALVFGESPYDTKSEIMADPRKAGGEYTPYPEDIPGPIAAPKGYKPFYISHFGRHGARYALGEDIYERFKKLLDEAHEAGRLTEAGEDLFARYGDFYPMVANRGGDLTAKGQEQHRAIASRMFNDYPEIFKGPTKAEVTSTASHRVLASMDAFMDELCRRDRSLDYRLDYGRVYLPVLEPNSSSNPHRVAAEPYPSSIMKKRARFRDARVDWEEISGRFFNDLPYLDSLYGREKFVQSLRTIMVDLPCLDNVPDDTFDGLLSVEELYRIWQVKNFDGYLYFGRSPGTGQKACKEMSASVRDIIDRYEEDLAGGVALRLRFTHDTCLMPLLSYLGVNHFGDSVSDPFEVENHWRCFDVPMASNLQFVFYSGRKGDGTIFKVLLNGSEATLPLDPVCPYFYKWEDFKAYYGEGRD